MKNIFLFLFCICLVPHLEAQNEPSKLLRQVIPPSPNASSLGIYGDIPVSLYTGTPNISVPLYTIQHQSISLPIGISYHTSSIKADVVASNVGLGWSLNAGGVITRTMHGLHDEKWDGGYLYNNIDPQNVPNLTLTQQQDIQLKIKMNALDLEPDVFNFNFLGFAGTFLIERGTQKGYMLNNDKKISIQWFAEKNNTVAARLKNFFVITDQNGFKYHFGISKNQVVEAREYSKTIIGTNPFGRTEVDGCEIYPSAWYLTDIIAPTGENITLEYEDYNFAQCLKFQTMKYQNLTPDYQDAGNYHSCKPIQPKDQSRTFVVEGKRVKNINFGKHKVEFKYQANRRLDVYEAIGFGDNALEFIEVYSENIAVPIKKYLFSYSYFSSIGTNQQYCLVTSSINHKLKLNSITDITDVQNPIPPYLFSYHTNSVPNHLSNSQDHWGYYNSRNNTDLFPEFHIYYQEFYGSSNNQYFLLPGADRKPDHAVSNAGILTKIKYPTGGETIFEYEGHDAYMKDFVWETHERAVFGTGPTYNKPIGGPRIKKVTNKENNGTLNVKSYLYRQENNPNNSSGVLVSNPQYHFFYNEWIPLPVTWYCSYLVRVNTSKIPLFLTQGSHIGYSHVEEIQGDNSQYLLGKTSTTYTTSNNYPDEISYEYPFPPPITQDYKRGLMLNQKQFIYDSNTNLLKLVKETINTYHLDNRYSKIFPAIYAPEKFPSNAGLVYLVQYTRKSEWFWLKSTKEITYDQTDNTKYIEKEVQYNYENPSHLQLTKSMSILGPEGNITKQILYPSDRTWTGILASNNALNTAHIFAPAGERVWIDRDGQKGLLSASFIKYDAQTFKPVGVYQMKPLDPFQYPDMENIENYTLEASFGYNVDGLLIEQQRTNDIVETYLWGYYNQYPIAKVLNTKSKDVFYTSFENDTYGVSSNGGKTGKKYWTGEQGKFWRALTGLSEGNYKLSYWKKQGTAWVYHEEPIDVNASGNYDIEVPENTAIDEVRFFPANAFITTYTYEPLVGMTSQTDTNNQTIYYEYDSLGRLRIMRDDKGNILKKMEYHYKE